MLDPEEAYKLAKGFEADNKGALTTAMIAVYATKGNSADWPFIYAKFKGAAPQAKFNMLPQFSNLAAKADKPEHAQQGITELKAMGLQFRAYGVVPYITGFLTTIKDARTKMNDTASATMADNAINELKSAK
jgi:aminopeptidase N